MIFKPYYLGCLAHASYLIGGSNGEAVVVDPRRDVSEYIHDAAELGLTIKHVIETHLHADFVSGHIELARKTGATIYLGQAVPVEFPCFKVKDGDEIDLGDVKLRFLETPGHTPESITILVFENGNQDPRLALTGDTLFIGDVGRPDLVASKGLTPEQMATTLFYSLQNKLIGLPPEMEIWPAHGAGSACGKSLSNERVSSLGAQFVQNYALGFVLNNDLSGFVEYATEGLSASPTYFGFDAETNRTGAPSVEEIMQSVRNLTPVEFDELREDTIALDTRSGEEFASGHIPGAINIPLEGKFAPWVGAVISPEEPLLLICGAGKHEESVTRLCRIGYDKIIGSLDGGMNAWIAANGELQALNQVSVDELKVQLNTYPILDVRTVSEWESGHIAGAIHIPLPELAGRFDEVPTETCFVMCGSGYRSTIACSMLQRKGKANVVNVSGGWSAWTEIM